MNSQNIGPIKGEYCAAQTSSANSPQFRASEYDARRAELAKAAAAWSHETNEPPYGIHDALPLPLKAATNRKTTELDGISKGASAVTMRAELACERLARLADKLFGPRPVAAQDRNQAASTRAPSGALPQLDAHVGASAAVLERLHDLIGVLEERL